MSNSEIIDDVAAVQAQQSYAAQVPENYSSSDTFDPNATFHHSKPGMTLADHAAAYAEQVRAGVSPSEAQEIGGSAVDNLIEHAMPVNAEAVPMAWACCRELTDTEGIARPVFAIAGHEVIFRNRNEFPQLEEPYHEVGNGQLTHPIDVFQQGPQVNDPAYLEAQQPAAGENVLEVVPNTPVGLLGAAMELGGHDEQLATLLGEFNEGTYSPAALDLIDKMAAATMVSHEGELNQLYDTDGFALVLASLLGEPAAQSELSARLTNYRQQREAYFQSEWQKLLDYYEVIPDSEVLKPEDVVLVHSTSYPAEIDETGAAILYPIAAKREDEWPRATLHFTPNAEVTAHEGGGWDHTNRLIISNYQAMVDANGLPAVSNPVDTFYAINPGQHLTLPDALIIESRTEGPIIQREGNVMSYVHKDAYTDAELAEIKAFETVSPYYDNPEISDKTKTHAAMTTADYLRRSVLAAALIEKGAKQLVSIGDASTTSESFDRGFCAMTTRQGVRELGVHFDTEDGQATRESQKQLYDGLFTGLHGYLQYTPGTTYRHASDATIRTLFAGGFTPARPIQAAPVESNRNRSNGVG